MSRRDVEEELIEEFFGKQEARKTFVFNTYEQVAKGEVFIGRRVSQGYRDVLPSAWVVHRKGYQTDPGEGNWHYNYDKAFTFSDRQGADESLEEAKAWASKRYGIAEWKKNGSGDWVNAACYPTYLPIREELVRKAKAKKAAQNRKAKDE